MSSTTSAALAPTSTAAPTGAPLTPAEANRETELARRGQAELDSSPAPPPTGASRAAGGDLVAHPVPYRFSSRELLLAVRPHQWVKNALVMIVPIDADKLHPTKQLRPIASGTLSVSDARAATP